MLRLVLDDPWKLLWPGVALALLASALLFPMTAAAGLAFLVLVALCGAVLAAASARLKRPLPSWSADLIIAVVVCAASVQLFAAAWNVSGYRIYDWGPHHANLRHLVDALREGRVPAWVHGVSSGDSPFELYAFLPYYLAAKAAIFTGATDLTLVLVRSGIVTHSLAALGTALLARRVVPWPWAMLVGLGTLYDVGSVWGGGAEGILLMGVTHSAFAQAIWSFVLILVLSSLRRPRLLTSACIWGAVAFAVACHPLALVSALGTMGALVLVALLGRDVPRHRALSALVHVGIGLLLVAFVWMPFGERLLLYGVHYGIAPSVTWAQLGYLLSQPVPEASVAAIVYAGYLGVVVGVLSRRAAPTLLASFAGIIMAGLFDQLYALLELVPSLQTAGFQMVRLPSVAKPSLYVMGVYLVDSALARRRPAGSAGTRWVAGALLALGALGLARGALPHFDHLGSQLRALAFKEVPDSAGLRALAGWAREQNAAMPPGQYGRLLDEDERRTFAVFHVHAESGLPTLWIGPTLPLFFLRERIEDASPASLRRFNVRWVMRADRPPSLGDPATEKRFGRYIVRELPEWDGRFARVERGGGNAIVTRLDDERVEVDLVDTTEPALVALGMGYYPRWVARHEQRGILPLYAMPSMEGGKLHVPAAWLPPGRTTFSPSGALPSDGQGRPLSILAALAAAGILVTWAWLPAARRKVLFLMARSRRWLKQHQRPLGFASVGVATLGVLLASLSGARAPARALQLGNGLGPSARVDVRSEGGEWRKCRYSPLAGAYRCPGRVFVQDTLTNLLNDAPPSLPFTVPAINVAASSNDIEIRLRLEASLTGEYWAATNGYRVGLAVDNASEVTLSGAQISQVFEASGSPRAITLMAKVPARKTLQVTFVQRERLQPARVYPSVPAHSPY